jgi:hypothetical protein
VIESWLTAIRDHPSRPPAAQRHVLTMLALRMDWKTAQGYASTQQLTADADASKATVKRATAWARGASLLKMISRGHRITADRVTATKWALCQGLTDEPLGGSETDTQGLRDEPLGDVQGLTGESQGLNGGDPRAHWGPPINNPKHQDSNGSEELGLPIHARPSRPGPSGDRASRQAHADKPRERADTQTKILRDVRAAIAQVYGDRENIVIEDEEALGLWEALKPRQKRVAKRVAYLVSIFEQTPDIDTLCAKIPDDDEPQGDTLGVLRFGPNGEEIWGDCPRCGGKFNMGNLPNVNGICVWCEGELKDNTQVKISNDRRENPA